MKVEVRLDADCRETTVTVTAAAMTEEVQALVELLGATAEPFLAGYREGTVTPLEAAEVLSFRTEGDRVLARTEAGDYTVRLRLYELERRLDGRRFVRISQSELVNLKQVRQVDLSLAGTIRMTLSDGSVSYVSRRCVKKIKQALGIGGGAQ